MSTQQKQSKFNSIKKYFEFSKILCYTMTLMTMYITYEVIGFAKMAITTQYLGSLPFLTTMITVVWGAYGTVLSFVVNKSKAENLNKYSVNRNVTIPINSNDGI